MYFKSIPIDFSESIITKNKFYSVVLQTDINDKIDSTIMFPLTYQVDKENCFKSLTSAVLSAKIKNHCDLLISDTILFNITN